MKGKNTMKKILSIIFSALMIMSCLVIMPVSAEQTTAAEYTSEGNNVLYTADLTKTASAVDLGVTPIDYQWSNVNSSSDWTQPQVHALTADGLVMAPAYRHFSGFAIKAGDFVDLSELSSYTVEISMQADIISCRKDFARSTSYIWFGWGQNPEDKTITGTQNDTNGLAYYWTNFRTPGNARFHLNNTSYSPDNRIALYTAMDTANEAKQDSTFSFAVANNYLSTVTVTSGSTTQVFNANANILSFDASSGEFYIFAHSTNLADCPYMKVSSITVKNSSGTTVGSVDFKAKYAQAVAAKAPGATTIDFQFATGTDNTNFATAGYTDEGLLVKSAYRYTQGVRLSTSNYDLTKHSDYAIKVDMRAYLDNDYTNVIYFGWGLPADDSFYATGSTLFENSHPKTFFKVVDSALTIDGWTIASGDAVQLRANMDLVVDNVTLPGETTMEFRVVDNKCSEVVVSCGGVTVKYTHATGLDASAGNFGMYNRVVSAKASTNAMIIKSISVIDNNVKMVGHQKTLSTTSTYGIRFISVINDIDNYDAMGYDVVASIDGGASSKNFSNTSKYVYSSIKGYTDASSVSYTPADFNGEYFYCDTLFDIPAGTDVEFTVTPFVIDTTGKKISFTSYTFEAENSVKVATYNIKSGMLTGGYTYGDSTGANAYDYSYIAADIKATGAEIVGLQEVDVNTGRNGNQDTVKLIADKLGYDYYYFASGREYDGGTFGNAIISKYPITSTETVAIPNTSGDVENRCALHAVINIDGSLVDFYVTHTESNSYETQLSSIYDNMISKRSNTSFVLLGDYNNHQYAAMEACFDESVSLLIYTGRYIQTCSGGAFDNMIMSSDVEFSTREVYGTLALTDGTSTTHNSDHLVLFSTLYIPY